MDGSITVKDQLTDQLWRLNNLYWIQDKKGQKVPFRLNWAQTRLVEKFWYLNVVLKARQLGCCLDPSTRVLTAQLKWLPIGDLSVGTSLIAVDEFPPGGRGRQRKMRTGYVQGIVELERKAYRVYFDDGREIVCTGKHPWLSRNEGDKKSRRADWRSIDDTSKGSRPRRLKIGSQIRYVTMPWDEPDYEDGWFAGMLDGEGTISNENRDGAQVTIAQRRGPIFDRTEAYLRERGYHYRIADQGAGRGFSDAPCPKLEMTRMDEIFRLAGQTGAIKTRDWRFWEGRELPGKAHQDSLWATIREIEPLGKQTVIDLQTTEGTYIAEGLVSHNTTLLDILLLDNAAFYPDTRCGIIAHTREDAKVIFQTKVKFPFEHLPDQIRNHLAPKADSTNEYLFSNNSSIRVGTSMRSGTLNYLHISEYAKLCAQYPEKAVEVRTGALNTLQAGQSVTIESTAEGAYGHFFDLCDEAQNNDIRIGQGEELTSLDWQFHFFPWWKEPSYVLPATAVRHVVITKQDAEYFADLEDKIGRKLSVGQKLWWVKKRDEQGEYMFREFPATPDEAFRASIEGAYYKKQMVWLRQHKRITNVPYEPALPVNTFWDLGLNDSMVIAFHQRWGNENRWIGYYENQGEGLTHYVKYLQDQPYTYGMHYLPHDAEVRSMETGVKRKDFLIRLGLRPLFVVPRIEDELDGIEAVRASLPTCWFDKTNCAPLIKALEHYRKEWDEKLGTFKSKPLHDWASHPAKAFEQFAVGFIPKRTSGRKNKKQRNWRTV